jgi:ligand-binding SRPBCC domain-containing protein
MPVHTFSRVSRLPVSPEKAWDFFSSPLNLKLITPADLGFHILSEGAHQKMFPGMLIRYQVSPLFRIPLTWVTEITEVSDGKFFVDEQRKGPFASWRHEHSFAPIPGGTEMHDQVSYEVPFGPLGSLAHVLFVRRQLEHIFDFRENKIAELFGTFEK